MRASALTLNGASLVADLSGALYWPDEALLAVADLHLEKGSSFAASGALLPPYDSRATLGRLAEAVARYRPRRVLCLGDSFHDAHGPTRLHARDREALACLQDGRDWLWIVGNHDPELPEGIGGEVSAEATVGELAFRHEASLAPSAQCEVSGHYHPKAAVSVRGKTVHGRCFVEDGRRLMLPAFGAFAGGLSALDGAISRLFPEGFRIHVIGLRRVHRMAGARLLGR